MLEPTNYINRLWKGSPHYGASNSNRSGGHCIKEGHTLEKHEIIEKAYTCTCTTNVHASKFLL